MGECGCGRSPNGKCIGWHGLSEEEYQEKLKEYTSSAIIVKYVRLQKVLTAKLPKSYLAFCDKS